MAMRNRGPFRAYLFRHTTKIDEKKIKLAENSSIIMFLSLINISKNSVICDRSQTVSASCPGSP